MANPGIDLEIDASELKDEIKFLQRVMKPEVFQRAMYGIMYRTGRHVSNILKKDLPKKYYVKSAEIGHAVKNPQMTMNGGMSGCVIPIVGLRKGIGGKGDSFSATGSRSGWQSLRGRYRISAQIVKGGRSLLPYKLSSYAGMPPFRNIPARRLNELTFTRTEKAALPIEKVSAIAVPQMPMNRSRDQVESDIVQFMDERINARIRALIKNGR